VNLLGAGLDPGVIGAVGTLCGAAAGIGCLHTVLGVDHYLPFIALGRARRWSLRRTLAVTALCGVGHVLGSLVLGAVGLGLGLALGRLEAVEAWRGDLSNLTLIGFGLAYAAWGLWRARRNRPHEHLHQHADGTRHHHPHHHRAEHAHPHADPARHATVVWSLFIVFAFGPCEALIPLLAAAASAGGPVAAGIVSLPFAAATIATMLVAVAVGRAGAKVAVPAAAERHAHTLAGLTLAASGLAVRYLGL
jgi:ABC-type nickel/cobalt efflux system permease component RcnA